MRIMPFMKRKNGVQFAGVGLDTGGGGGGGGGFPDITNTETLLPFKYNGKNAYMKRIEFTAQSGTVTELMQNIDRCIMAFGVLSNGQYKWTVPAYGGGSNGSMIFQSENILSFNYIGNAYGANPVGEITLIYTKL